MYIFNHFHHHHHHHHHHFICSEQATQHMTANANEQDQKAQRALKMALNA